MYIILSLVTLLILSVVMTLCVSSTRLQKIDINGRGLFSLCELRLYLPLHVDVQS